MERNACEGWQKRVEDNQHRNLQFILIKFSAGSYVRQILYTLYRM